MADGRQGDKLQEGSTPFISEAGKVLALPALGLSG